MNQKTTRISPEEIARQKDFCAQIHAMNAALPAQPLAYALRKGLHVTILELE